MHKIRLVIPFFFLLSFFSVHAHAQYYSSGADPASIKWEQIDTERFKMVFPEAFSETATELAFYLDSIAPAVEATMNHSPRKISILIHAHSTYSNGFVSWAPRRIELYPNPSQDNYSTDWLKQLAVHEYRHVVQIDKLRQGFTKIASWITGEQAVGAALGAYLPMWFIEGDAVITETTLSKSGRGRIPVFSQPLRARLTEYGYDKYEKAYLGSYKEYVPDYYQMGYHLTAEIRRRYGAEIWSDVIDNVGRNSWSLIPFRKELRKTGFSNPKKLYASVFDSLKTSWAKYDDTLKTSDYTLIAKGKDDYSNIEYPAVTENGHVFAQISGPGQRTRIVHILPDKKTTDTIAYIGYRNNDPVAANMRWVAWSESKPHIRWPNAEYSVIRLYDRNTGDISRLSNNSRYFSPALQAGGNTIAVIETTPEYKFFITFINVITGEIIKRIPTPQNAFPQHLSWAGDDENLIMILLNKSGKRIASLEVNSDSWKTIRPPAWDEPKFPEKRGDNLWFVASTQNSEELFRMNLSSGKTYQVTTARFGATTPALMSNDSIVYADYTPKGYQLVTTEAFNSEIENVTPKNLDNSLVKELSRQEPDIPSRSTNNNFKPESYSKWNLLNLHSWAPAYVNIDDAEISPGLTLMSQNLLGTAITRIGFNADGSKSREKYNAGFTYRGWYPIFDVDVKWGKFEESIDDVYSNGSEFFAINQIDKAQQIKVESGINIPFNLSSGKWNRLLRPRTKLSWQNISNNLYEQSTLEMTLDGELRETGETSLISYPDLDYWAMEYSLYFRNSLRGTSRDVGTRWGQSFSLIYRHTPWGNYNAGKAYGAHCRLNLPGFEPHHAIALDNSWQKKLPGDEIKSDIMPYRAYQRFGEIINLPRGYNNMYNDELYVFRSTYQMPLWNPDANILGLIYLKRFRLNLFFDAANLNYKLDFKDFGKERYSEYYTSTGIEVMTDFHPFRFVLPFSVGYRGGYRDGDNSFFHEAVFSTSFNSFLIN